LNVEPCSMARPRIGITLGDCAGIGPEIVDAALKSGRLSTAAQYQIIGDYPQCSLGQPTAETARAAVAALEEAAQLVQTGDIAAVVTAPIHKANMYQAGFQFPGQTEFFADRCGITNFAMLLTGGNMTVALVTTHIPLRNVPDSLKRPEIVRVGLLLAQFLSRRFDEPHIAVAGLNPHAGEAGNIGREEIDIIEPAVADLQSAIRKQRSAIFEGPIPPDTVFHRAASGEFDAVLCMYHDQGLIPLKLHAFDQGVNVTLGLPFPRTSPDHGTAFAIAGKGVARAGSMISAINLAAELASGW
jgi:4-hydroxythreonine-4-phosphate dehydrogenase